MAWRWVKPTSENLVPHAHVLMWAGGNGGKRVAEVVATRAGMVKVRYLTSEYSFWLTGMSRIIAVRVDDGQGELDL